MPFYVIFFRNRCMGFHADKVRAGEIAELLGEGSDVEECFGEFPTDEAVAAREHNERRAQSLVGLRVVKGNEAITLKLSPVESEALVSAMGADEISEDPWSDEPTQTFVTSESGFFKPAQVG